MAHLTMFAHPGREMTLGELRYLVQHAEQMNIPDDAAVSAETLDDGRLMLTVGKEQD